MAPANLKGGGRVKMVAVILMLLFALYGIAVAAVRAGLWLIRPKNPASLVVLRLAKCENDTEQQVRFAYAAAKERRLPLVVVDDERVGDAARRLLAQKNAVFINPGNLFGNSCEEDGNCV